MKAVEEILTAISALSEAEKRELFEKLSAATGEFTASGGLRPEACPERSRRAQPEGLPATRTPVLAFDAGQLEGQPDYVLVFDGGSMGNPGPGYGSYAMIRASDGKERVVRLDFGDEMTSNEAEYDTLIAGLRDLIQRLTEAKRSPSEFSIEVRGDSSLAINQVSGVWKARDERMRARRNQTRELLGRFAASRLVLQPRQESVRILGH